ncbi:MAG: penicillin-binding transpeptidase domain-containing protein, partial [Thermoanaerobaculia bacterium]|nr:penicillin-binding transpeptidase domain-containing protein [Thermoanaerobaculia bacterium]
IVLGRTRIRDHKPFGVLSFREVIQKSSNVGTIKAALVVGDERLYDMIRRFGFGRRTGVDLPGETGGIVNPLERWRPTSKAYVSFGQEISVTAIQMANAFAAIANGGVLHRPYVARAVGRGEDLEPIERETEGKEIIAAHTAVTLGRVLETVVEKGTGRKAQVAGYRVAGKTGTAEKVIPGEGYSATARMASFVGYLPARNPRLVGFVMLDHPRTQTHGGQVAAPVFGAIMKKALLYLGVPTDPDVWPPPEREVAAEPPEDPSQRPVTIEPVDPLLLPAGADT